MLSGPIQLEWIDAFFSAFSQQEFEDLLFHRLNDRIDNYVSQNRSLRAVIAGVVDAYSRRDWEGQLINKAIEARPSNAALLRLASTQKAAAAPQGDNLEKTIRDTNSFLDAAVWLNKAGKLQVCVCRMEIGAQGGGTIFGTGFLIGADLLMTNYHVVQSVIALEDNDKNYKGPRAKASDVECRFDYKIVSNGAKSMGTCFGLAKDWRVALSPNNPSGREPGIGELDCAVVRLAQRPGELAVGDNPRVPGDPRGWISLPAKGEVPSFTTHSPLFIIQHPEGDPLKLTLDTDAIESVNPTRTRVRYRTNSEPGSSGSPCFDQNWNLVALHHSGDPNFSPQFNEGIPMDTIASYLRKTGVTL